MVNLFYDAYSVLCKVYFDGAYIDKALYSTAIEPLNKAKTVKICYGVLDKDLYLEYFIGKLCERSPKQKIKLIVKIGMYAIRFLGKKPLVYKKMPIDKIGRYAIMKMTLFDVENYEK